MRNVFAPVPLRKLFQDELLIRTPKGYEPTPRGQALLDEMAVILPHIDRLLPGRSLIRSATEFVLESA